MNEVEKLKHELEKVTKERDGYFVALRVSWRKARRLEDALGDVRRTVAKEFQMAQSDAFRELFEKYGVDTDEKQ